MQVSKDFATDCGLSLTSAIIIGRAAKLGGHIVKVGAWQAALMASVQVMAAQTIAKNILHPRLTSETSKRYADIAAHLLVGGALGPVEHEIG